MSHASGEIRGLCLIITVNHFCGRLGLKKTKDQNTFTGRGQNPLYLSLIGMRRVEKKRDIISRGLKSVWTVFEGCVILFSPKRKGQQNNSLADWYFGLLGSSA